MMYPYMTLGDGTEITHSHIIDDNGKKAIEVHFERATEEGFDSARCRLPGYVWTIREGFSDDEINLFEKLLESNEHLIYKCAAHVPNADTIAAMKEIEEMEHNPGGFKRYSSFSEILNEVKSDV